MKKQLFLIAIVSACVCIALASMSHQQVGTSLRNALMGQPKASADGTAPAMNLAYTPTYTSGTKNWVTQTTPFNLATTDGFDEPFTGYGNGNNVTGTGTGTAGSWSAWPSTACQYNEQFSYTNGKNISTTGGCSSWNNWNPWHTHGNGAPVEYTFSESSGMGYYSKTGGDSAVSNPIYKPATAQSSYPGMLGIKFQCNAWPSGGSIEFEFDNSAVSTIECRVYICANGSLQVSNGVSHPVTVISMSLSTSYNVAIDAISSTEFDVIVDSTVYDNGGSHFNAWAASNLMGAVLIGYSSPGMTGGVYISSIWTEWHCSSGAGGPNTQWAYSYTQSTNGTAVFNKYCPMDVGGAAAYPFFTWGSAPSSYPLSIGYTFYMASLPQSQNNPILEFTR